MESNCWELKVRLEMFPAERFCLNPAEDVSIFYLFREDGTGDTIVLRYQREQQLISPDCGPTQRFFNLRVDTTRRVSPVWTLSA